MGKVVESEAGGLGLVNEHDHIRFNLVAILTTTLIADRSWLSYLMMHFVDIFSLIQSIIQLNHACNQTWQLY